MKLAPTLTKSDLCLKTVHRYDFGKDKWQRLPSLLNPRSHHASCAIGSSLYVFCGSRGKSGNTTDSIEKLINANSNKISAIRWQEIQVSCKFTVRERPIVSTLNDREIVIIGGYSQW